VIEQEATMTAELAILTVDDQDGAERGFARLAGTLELDLRGRGGGRDRCPRASRNVALAGRARGGWFRGGRRRHPPGER